MKSQPSHAQCSPTGLYSYVTDDFRPIRDQIRYLLGRLDGLEKYSYIVWRATPTDRDFVLPEDANDYFIQAAGSADAMTVEVRLPGPDGAGHLYTVGKSEPANGATSLIPISDKRAVRVFSNEVFTADDAAVILYTYYLTDAVSQPHVLRELDLTQELSEER